MIRQRMIFDLLDFFHPDLSTQIAAMIAAEAELEESDPVIAPDEALPEDCATDRSIAECVLVYYLIVLLFYHLIVFMKSLSHV